MPKSIMRYGICAAAALTLAASPAFAAVTAISGTRNNITPGGIMGGRCAPALTVNFAPNAFAASGNSNFGLFTYTASHCIAAPPPGSYFNGIFEWTFANGTLFGMHSGTLTTASQGVFNVAETLLFTGGTGAFAGATGAANLVGTVTFGQYEGVPVSFSNTTFTGSFDTAGVPEPSSWAMMIAGFGLTGTMLRRRQRAMQGVVA